MRILLFKSLLQRYVAYLKRVKSLLTQEKINTKKQDILELPPDIDHPEFDLGQSPDTVALDLNIESPLFIIPTGSKKSEEEAYFKADIGTISIKKGSKVSNRWVNHPSKTSQDTTFSIST